MSSNPAGWQPDPRGRHEYRYWDGNEWTEHVANQGIATTDPYEDAREQTAVQPAVTPEARTAGGWASTPEGAGGPGAREPFASTTSESAAPEGAGGPGAREPFASTTSESAAPGGFGATRTPYTPASGPGPRMGEPRTGGTSSTTQAKAAAQQAMHSKSPELASILSVIAPGSGHFYLGTSKVPIAAGLLIATVVAVVLAYMSFVLFLVGFAIWAAAAAFALTDLRGSLKGLENTTLPPNIAAILIIAGGALLIVALLLPWYHISVSSGGLDLSENGSGFEVLEIIDIVLLAIGVIGVVAGGAALGMFSSGGLPKALPMAVAVGGAVATVLVLFRMFVDGSEIPSGADITIGRAPGILLALDAALVLLIANAGVLRSARR